MTEVVAQDETVTFEWNHASFSAFISAYGYTFMRRRLYSKRKVKLYLTFIIIGHPGVTHSVPTAFITFIQWLQKCAVLANICFRRKGSVVLALQTIQASDIFDIKIDIGFSQLFKATEKEKNTSALESSGNVTDILIGYWGIPRWYEYSWETTVF